MRVIRDKQRSAHQIRRERWQNLASPVLTSSAVVAAFGAIIYWLSSSKLTFSANGVRAGLQSRRTTRAETVLPSAPRDRFYPYSGIVKIGGGSVIGRSRTPIRVGQEMYAEYQTTRYGVDSTTIRLRPLPQRDDVIPALHCLTDRRG